MDIRDALSAELPPPRDDEPAGLRQDILDELADHLTCAYHRELLRGAGPDEARRRVLNRFGDPAAVARRLWLDAMKGKIMAQRILIATCLVVTLASLTMVGVMWRQTVLAQQQQSVAAQRQAEMTAQALRELSLQNVKAQDGQLEMLKQLRAMSEANRTPRSPDWNPVKFKLTEDSPGGAPVVGCSITLRSQRANEPPRSRKSDASGIADMGILQPGEYTVHLSKTWDDGNLWGDGGLIVEPGSTVEKVVPVPRKLLERVPVRIRCVLPDDLKKEGLVLEAPFFHEQSIESDVRWNVYHRWTSGKGEESASFAYSMTRPLLVGPWPSVPGHDRPALAEIFNSLAGLYLWAPGKMTGPRASVLAKDVHSIDEPEPTLMWERGSYSLSSLLVLRPLAGSDGKGGMRHFAILADAQRYANGAMGISTYEVRDSPPTVDTLESTQRNGMSGMSEGTRHGGIQLSDEYWARLDKSFQARPVEVNEWTLRLPDELIRAVRAKLKAAKP